MPSLTRFALLTHPRCGSTYLATLLNSHPQVLCHGELFYQHQVFYAVGYRDGSLHLATPAERDADPAAFLDKVWGHPFGNSAVGFKLVRMSGLPLQILAYLEVNAPPFDLERFASAEEVKADRVEQMVVDAIEHINSCNAP